MNKRFINLILVLLPMTVMAQERPVTLRMETDVVAIDIVATDLNGNHIRDLRREELELIEDGRSRTFDLFAVNQESTLSRPLAVVFALDLSGSLKLEETITLRESALKFLDLVKGDSVFAAITFNNEVKVRQGFTRDVKKLADAFSRAVRFEGSTRIYDAIDRGVTMLNRQAPRFIRDRPVRRALVVISDGFDSASIIDRRELVRRAMATGVTVYSITLPSYVLSATRRGERVLTPLDATRIVQATGGNDFAADAGDFTPVFRALAEEIRATYAIAFYPESRDGKPHRLEVRTSRPGVKLRTSRTGYQAPQR